LFRHVQVQLRPLCCGVDTSRSSTGLSNVDMSICNSGPCGVDTSIGAAHASFFVQTRPGAHVLWCRRLEETHRLLPCRHVKVQSRPLSVDQSRISTGFCFQRSPGAAQTSVAYTHPDVAVASVVY
jgi:hypothetical protein